METREVFSKLDGVIRVHPFGHNGKCLVYVKNKKTFNEKVATEALAKTKKLRVRKMKQVRG